MTDTPALQNFDPVTVALQQPVEHDGKIYAGLTFREAELGDLCAADHFKGEMAKIAALLAGMAEVPVQVIRKLKARDANAITEKVGHLMGNDPARTTGGT